MAVLAEKSKKLLAYLQAHQDEDLTSQDIADIFGLEKRSVDGSFTSLVKKKLGERIPAEREEEDGMHVRVKLLKLTERGLVVDPEGDIDIPE